MTCPAPPRGCTTQFCFHCLSMDPHCGSKCKKPKEANILRQKWKKERMARQKLTYETARQFQSNTETKQANEEHKRELREATESKTAMEVNLFEMRLYDKQMELEQVELGKCEVELEREKTKQAARDAWTSNTSNKSKIIDDLLESNSTFNLQGSWDDTLLLSENNKSQKRANCSGQMLRENYDYNERHGKAEVAGTFSKAANVTERKIVKVRRDDDLDQVNMNTDSRNGMFEFDSSL